MTLRLRRATADDSQVLARIHRHAFFTAMPNMPVLHTPADDVAFYADVVLPQCEVWVAEHDGTARGLIAFRPGWVDHLYVLPQHQRCGIGSILLQIAQQSQASLKLWTFRCNAAARTFYERHRFQVERETDGSGNEERQPDVLYAWKRDR